MSNAVKNINLNIPMRNIYYMLCYAYDCPIPAAANNYDFEKFYKVQDLLAVILLYSVNKLVKRGLFRDYITIEDEILGVKGQIKVEETINKQTLLNKKLYCSFDEYSEDVNLNQIIKTTLEILVRSAINKEIRRKIKRTLRFFSSVSSLDVSGINWNILYNRTNSNYKMLIVVCEQVIKNMIQSDTKSRHVAYDFYQDWFMSKLYEKFILAFYDKECTALEASAKRLYWSSKEDSPSSLPSMLTDIFLENKRTNKILIIDAKYYNSSTTTNSQGDTKYHTNNLYQIFSYVKHTEFLSQYKDYDVAGMLLYAKTKDSALTEERFSSCGSQFIIKFLDLDREFNDIKNQLVQIAQNNID